MLHLAWGRRRWERYLGERRMGIEERGGGKCHVPGAFGRSPMYIEW